MADYSNFGFRVFRTFRPNGHDQALEKRKLMQASS